MSIVLAVVFLVVGLLVLVAGAELLVRGASGLATRLGVAPLVVGLTIVAFGTSSPELAVSINAAWSDQPDIVVGNAVGSNIFNVLFILGVSALITPLAVNRQIVRVDVPIMIGVSIAVWLLLRDGALGRWDGGLLLVGIIAYTAFAVQLARREEVDAAAELAPLQAARDRRPRPSVGRQSLFIVIGLALCVVGARLFVDGAVHVARSLGMSELIIGLTIVAAGTSLPEVATSITAAVRGQRDIAVGNVVGSNIFNLLGILGVTGLFAPVAVMVTPAAVWFDLPVSIAVAVACLPIVFTGHRIDRWEGGVFVVAYACYVVYLVLGATHHDLLNAYSNVMLVFVLPLTLTGIAASVWHARTHRKD